MVTVLGTIAALAIRYSPYLLEASLLLAVARIARLAPTFADRGFRQIERAFRSLARRKRLAVVATGVAALAGRALLLPILPIRQPAVTDEFSYLLAADTFASGRLTNPAHPMWVHFESEHILQHPTYASMYHAAQGLLLAAGQVAFGHAWAGVYLSVAAMCALVCWMLQGWLPPAWALLGGMLAVMRLGLYGYWINSYWGGAAAAIGGLLVLGALPRIQRKMRWRDAALLGLGMAILANSRPYEGFVLSLAVCGILALWMGRKRGAALRMAMIRVILPPVVVLTMAGCGMGYYYWRVTGNPLRMPYQIDRDEYAPARIFLWENPLTPPAYHNAQMRNFYVGWELAEFMAAKTPAGLVKNTIEKAGVFWMFFLGPAFTVPLLFLPWMASDRRIRALVLVGAVFLIGLGLNTWFYPHYAAPITGLIYAMVVQGLRHLRAWRPGGKASGRLLARSVPAICLLLVVLRAAAQPAAFFMPPDWPMTWYSTRGGNVDRARIEKQLEDEPGRELALVRYQPRHNHFDEWVYNAASIDAAKVVWARELDERSNAELIHYYADRRVWLVEPDAVPPRVSVYTKTSGPQLYRAGQRLDPIGASGR